MACKEIACRAALNQIGVVDDLKAFYSVGNGQKDQWHPELEELRDLIVKIGRLKKAEEECFTPGPPAWRKPLYAREKSPDNDEIAMGH